MPMKTGKLVKLNKTIYPLVEITLQKGKNTNISWGCLSALVEAKIASDHAKMLLDEEKLIVNEDILEDEKFIEGECFKI